MVYKCAIKQETKIKKINLEGLQLNGIYLLVFADDGNLMAEDKNVKGKHRNFITGW